MTSPDAAAKKAVINELSALAQSVWFTLLGALAFLGIVLLQHRRGFPAQLQRDGVAAGQDFRPD
jgi:hypothetical protein